MGQQGTPYALERKVRILNEIAAGESSAMAIAEREKIPVGSLYNWKSNEKAIRAAYAKEQKQAEKSNGKHSNGSNGHVSPQAKSETKEEQPTTKLQILGLTPLIKELVKQELDRQLPGLVQEAISQAFAGKRAN